VGFSGGHRWGDSRLWETRIGGALTGGNASGFEKMMPAFERSCLGTFLDMNTGTKHKHLAFIRGKDIIALITHLATRLGGFILIILHMIQYRLHGGELLLLFLLQWFSSRWQDKNYLPCSLDYTAGIRCLCK
jgi:hypothetical protein